MKTYFTVRLDPLYVSADGVTVHTRESGWREQCVGAVYTTKRSGPEMRSQAISYTTELGARTKFAQQLWLEAARRGLQQAVQQWMNSSLAHLAQSNTALILQQLHPLADSSPAVRSAITYFTNNLTRMDYARYRKLKLQIGSGTIESACKHLIDARLKQAGMRWKFDNARSVAKLHARFKSQRWHETIALRPLPSRSYSRLALC